MTSIRDEAAAQIGIADTISIIPVVPNIVPVVPLEPKGPPPIGQEITGQVFAQMVANAGFRSELVIVVSRNLSRGSVVKAWVTPYAVAAGQGYEIVVDAEVTGFTEINTPYLDRRLGGSNTDVFVGRKNTAAATVGGSGLGDAWVPTDTAQAQEFGPFFLVGSDSVLVRPTADNLAVRAFFRWIVLSRRD